MDISRMHMRMVYVCFASFRSLCMRYKKSAAMPGRTQLHALQKGFYQFPYIGLHRLLSLEMTSILCIEVHVINDIAMYAVQ